MEKQQTPNLNLGYDEYEQLEAEAEQSAAAAAPAIPVDSNPNAPIAPSAGARNTMARREAAMRDAPALEQSDDQQLSDIDDVANAGDAEVQDIEASENMPKWVPFHQPEKIGLINSITREVMEGFKDEGTATGMAKILNEIDAIIVGGGYQ